MAEWEKIVLIGGGLLIAGFLVYEAVPTISAGIANALGSIGGGIGGGIGSLGSGVGGGVLGIGQGLGSGLGSIGGGTGYALSGLNATNIISALQGKTGLTTPYTTTNNYYSYSNGTTTGGTTTGGGSTVTKPTTTVTASAPTASFNLGTSILSPYITIGSAITALSKTAPINAIGNIIRKL